jgi:hypothetical protein
MDTLDTAILKTIIYGDVFHFPMTSQEIHHFLIHNKPVTYNTIVNRLQSSTELETYLCHNDSYYALKQHDNLLSMRIEREQMMQPLSKQVTYYGRILSYFPFVELVGITGALAMRNPASTVEDLDYIIITRPERVWLARAFIILLVRLIRLKYIEICPNYVLASNQLVQSRQDLYIAHEISQMLPLSNDNLYKRLRDQNQWATQHLPNALHPFHQVPQNDTSRLGMVLKRGIEVIFSTPLGNWLERWEYRRKAPRFEEQAQAPTAAAQIDTGHVKGHFNDYGYHVLEQYYAKLEELGIVDTTDIYKMQNAGD